MQEYLTGELILTQLPRYHINRERAHLHLAQICMCYISVWLKLAQGSGDSNSTPVNVSTGSQIPSSSTSQPLRNYALDDAPDHLWHLGSHFELILPDTEVLEKAIQ